MALIEQGYNGKVTSIRVVARERDKVHGGRTAELWVEQTGANSETLSYVTLDELLTLRDEINEVIQALIK